MQRIAPVGTPEGYPIRRYACWMLLRRSRSLPTRLSGLLLVLAAMACLIGMRTPGGATPPTDGDRMTAAVSPAVAPPTSNPQQIQADPGSRQLLTENLTETTPMLMAAMGECVAVIAALSVLLILPRTRIAGSPAQTAKPRDAAAPPPAGPLLRACIVLQV